MAEHRITTVNFENYSSESLGRRDFKVIQAHKDEKSLQKLIVIIDIQN